MRAVVCASQKVLSLLLVTPFNQQQLGRQGNWAFAGRYSRRMQR